MVKIWLFLVLSLGITLTAYAKNLDGIYIHEDSGKDYDAQIIIKNSTDNSFEININAAEYSRFTTCEFLGKCTKTTDNTFKCLSGDEENPEQYVKFSLLDNNFIQIEDHYPSGFNCGLACYFDGKYAFKAAQLVTEKKTGTENLRAICPHKVLDKGTLRGIYLGNECGDNCWSTLKFADNQTYTFLCGEEESEKFFGSKKGVHVELTYEVFQDFFDLSGGENPECIRIEACKTGNLIDNKIPLSTNVDNIVCKEKILDTGSVEGVVSQFENSDAESNNCTLFLKLKNKEDYIVNISCNDTPKYQDYLGKDIQLNYSVLQHSVKVDDTTQCVREDIIQSIKAVE